MEELKKQFEDIEIPSEIDLAIEKGIRRGKSYKKNKFIRPVGVAAAVLFLCITLVCSAKSGKLYSGIKNSKKTTSYSMSKAFDSKANTENINGKEIELPAVGSAKNLKHLLDKYAASQKAYELKGSSQALADGTAKTAGASSDTAKASSNANMDSSYSSTNIQVQGVDEADVVKTDGSYIYKINSNKSLSVVKAVPASNMEVLSTISFDTNFSALGMFLNDKYLAVIGTIYNASTIKDDMKAYYSPATTKVLVYDISDKKNLKLVKNAEFDGNYTSSRMIDSRIFIVANKNIMYSGGIVDDKSKISYKDSSAGDKEINIDYSDIKYFPDNVNPNYIIVASIDLKNINESLKVSAFLGSGYNIYSSEINLYVAGIKQVQDENKNWKGSTVVYKLAYDGDSVKCVGKGEVPGNVLNQFSMDEDNGFFRIATTIYNFNNLNSSGENKLTNSLYILDNNMNIKGKIENIAPGERIYSVRFMEDRAYMVTYIQTDPLFVIDLKEPSNPKILGELKIPGFSNYLQPYDKNHIIGIGNDSTVVSEGGTDRAKTLGVKIAMFDVTDVTNPIQKFVTVIGGFGTYSDALIDNKALLLSKEKNILALPIDDRVMENNISKETFQGAYIFNIDVEKGITLKGKVTHADADSTDAEAAKIKNSFYGDFKVNRILYINDNIYTLSNACIKANDINTMQVVGEVITK